MGTRFEILFARGRFSYARLAARAAFAELERLERELSRFVPTGDIARLNAARPGRCVRMGADALGCLRIAEALRRDTGGAFDVAAARGRGRPGRRFVIPRRSGDVRRGRDPVDLGGIGKGYALDRMAELLEDWGLGPALLHAGQSTALATAPPSPGSAWRMKLRHPAKPKAVLGEVRITRGAVSGSAARLHGFHIVDPATGRPLRRSRASWAAARTAAAADALSTAFFVMSPEAGAKLCARRRGIAGLIAERGGFRKLGAAPGVRFVLPRAARLG